MFLIQGLKCLFLYLFIFDLELFTTAAKLLKLTPSVMLSYSEEDFNLTEVIELYKDDLPSPEVINQELFQWRFK